MKIARITLSDRASAGIYVDRSGPEIERIVGQLIPGEHEWLVRLMPDERADLEALLCSPGARFEACGSG